MISTCITVLTCQSYTACRHTCSSGSLPQCQRTLHTFGPCLSLGWLQLGQTCQAVAGFWQLQSENILADLGCGFSAAVEVTEATLDVEQGGGLEAIHYVLSKQQAD